MKIFLCLIFTISAHTQAKEVYVAGGPPNIIGGANLLRNSTPFESYGFLNEQQFIYGSTDNGNTDNIHKNYRVYSYDIENLTSTLLVQLNTSDIAGVESGLLAGEFWEFAKLDNIQLFSIMGKLYSTDGTKSGTTEIYDFGVFFCCGYASYYGKQTKIAVINGIAYYRVFVDFDVRYTDQDDPTTNSLWRSDGTKSGTFQLTEKESYDSWDGGYHLFANTAYNANAAFYFKGNSLYQIVGSTVTELTAFEYEIADIQESYQQSADSRKATISSSDSVPAIQTDVGAFLCVSYTDSESTNLWLFDANGDFKKVGDDCETLIEFGDQLIISSDSGLSLYDIQTGSEQPLTSEYHLKSYDLGFSHACIIDDTIYFPMESTDYPYVKRIYRIDENGAIEKITFENQVAGDSLFIEGCIEEEQNKSIVIFSKGAYLESGKSKPDNYFHYNTETAVELDVIHRNTLYREYNNEQGGFLLEALGSHGYGGPYWITLSNLPPLTFLPLLLE